jgi:hypothetical protein
MCEKNIETLILNSGASFHRLTFLPIFTDQAVFKISSIEPSHISYSLKVWPGSLHGAVKFLFLTRLGRNVNNFFKGIY